MSTIESLSIQGIRSFGVKAEDKQTIKFASPLTLILGANGCGKTTIIECLKYALTGEVPPGSNRGQSFIHDPNIFDYIECLAQVKLLVKNIRGEQLTVTRSMKIGHKRGKLSFETLDGTISFLSAEKEETISKRCIDIDNDMCHFMGVSKAIINNVIFCHQEDSSWPLDEAKKLKEKFDAIFGTSEYNKAIDKIMKLRKEQQDKLKLEEANLKYLNHIKKEAEDKNFDLENAKEKLKILQENCLKYEDEIKPIEEKLSTIYKVEAAMSKLQAVKIELSTKLKNCKEQAQSLSSKIKNLFEGNIHQLEREIRNFHETVEEKNNELHTLQDALESIKNQERKIQSTLTELDRKRTSLIHQKQQEQDYASERAKKITELCNHLGIAVPIDLEDSSVEITEILGTIKDAFKKEESRIEKLSADHDKDDQDMQAKIDKLRETKASLESDISSKKSQKDQVEKEEQKLIKQIKSIENDSKQLEQVTTQVEKLNKEYENLCNCINLDEIKNSIAEKRKNVDKLQARVEELDIKLTFLSSISKSMAEINIKEKELEKREQEVKRVKNKHSDNIKKLFPSKKIESNYKRNLQSYYDDLQRQIKDYNSNINSAKLKEKEMELIRKNQKDKLTRSEKELADGKDRIFDKCHSTSYEELLGKSKETIEKLQLDLGAFKSADAMYKKYIKKIEDDPCCPLCHKCMSTNEASDLTSELSDEIHRLPDNINRTEMLLKKEQIKYEGLLSLRPIIEKVEHLEEEIPKLKTELKSTEVKLAEAANEVESFQLLTAEPNSNVQLVNSMLGDMTLLDEAMKDVARISVDIEKLKAKLPEGSESAESMENVQMDKTTVAAELKIERAEVDKLHTKYEKDNEKLNKMRETRNSLKDQQIKLQEGIQALSQFKARKEEIRCKINATMTELGDLQDKLEPLKRELQKFIHEKQRTKEENKKVLNVNVSKLDSLKKIDHDIQRYTREIKALEELNLSEELELLKGTMKKYLEDQKSKAKDRSDTATKIENIKSEIANQEVLERDLKDNKELKLIQQKENALQSQYDDLAKDMGELDYKNVPQQKVELITRRENITVKKGEILGQQGEINAQINKLNSELSQERYKDSIKNFRKIFYEVAVLKKVINDLGQYRIALEWALMEFHSEKMQKINRLIRELWRQIYRGNDIDYIQIQTDEMKTDTADKKRSYNYRVVQSKNGSQIDMRGRCSAGQRVLASLIIRMALAETFSSNCGVLALDEPTTNLDRSNIISLCEALNKIVEERQSQSNFMLIIITHDEEFISTLGRIRSYYKLQRDDNGKSVIRKVRVA